MATTIYTYLHNDDLNGSRIVSMDDCMCKLYNIKRDDTAFIDFFKSELQKPALYILLNQKNRQAYIGETDDFLKRIPQHIAKKGFWDEVMVFMGTNEDTLSKTEVQYLEYLSIEKAKQVRSFDMSENSQEGKLPHMNVMQKSKTDKFFNYVQFLARFVGCDLFEIRKEQVVLPSNETTEALVLPQEITIDKESLKGNAKLSLNGEGKYSKREMVLNIVKEFIKCFPDATYEQLRATFKRNYLGRFAQYEFLSEDIESAKNWQSLGEDHVHYFINEKDILTSSDGVQFVVCVEWDRNNIINVLGIAQALGWTFNIVKNNHK